MVAGWRLLRALRRAHFGALYVDFDGIDRTVEPNLVQHVESTPQ